MGAQYYCGDPDNKKKWELVDLTSESQRVYLELIPKESVFFKTPKKYYWYTSGKQTRLCSPTLELEPGFFDESVEGCFIYEFIFEGSNIVQERELVCTG
ncbi:hypothetical protein GL2_30330 [Microbulbifer sp. GL-2]|nr:hypothetical protein GL2_30330 [Microbulbifer sp. GL-2]